MNIEQAKLLAAGYRHALGVGAMDSGNSNGYVVGLPYCFVGHMYKEGLVQDNSAANTEPDWSGNFMDKFGVSTEDARKICHGDYKTGPECATIVKDLLEKYGHQLDANGYIIERDFAAEIMQQVMDGPKLVEEGVS